MLALLLSLRAPKVLDVNIYHVLLAIFAVVILALICHAIYNRYYHPLHKFPGPFWGSVTDLYNTYLFGTRQVHIEQLRLHESMVSTDGSRSGATTKLTISFLRRVCCPGVAEPTVL